MPIAPSPDYRRIAAGVVTLEFCVAVQAVVLVAVMPAVLRDLGHRELYGWVFGVYAAGSLVGTPIGGWAVDRLGVRRPLAAGMAGFALATIAAGLSPGMLALLVARAAQGLSTGALYSISLAAVARSVAAERRPRLLALVSTAWVMPSLVGPALGAVITGAVGWRWAIWSILLPLAVASGLLLRGLPDSRGVATARRWLAPVLAAPSRLRLAFLSRLLLDFGWFGANAFVPLAMTQVAGASLLQAAVAITITNCSWTAGSWVQQWAVRRRPEHVLVLAGAGLVAAGVAGLAAAVGLRAGLAGFYPAGMLAGLGMGLAYPSLTLVAMASGRGAEGAAMTGILLSDRVGMAVGPVVGGALVGAAAGFTGAFAVCAAGALTVAAVAPRLGASAGVEAEVGA